MRIYHSACELEKYGKEVLSIRKISILRLIEKAGRPIRVHGYGMTDPKIMHMFPWFSVDSTTAHMAAKVGLLITPDGFQHVWTGGRNKDDKPKGVMEKLRDWAHDFHPSLNWDLASEYAGEGQVYKMALNVSFMEEEWTRPPQKKGGGFGLL